MSSNRTTLNALLDALETELLAAPAEEVRTALLETGRARAGAIQEIRSLLRDAEADSPRLPPLDAAGKTVSRRP